MGHAIDTIGLYATNAGAAGTAPTVSAGDSLTVKNFPASATAQLRQLFRQDTTEGFVQITSTQLVNNTTGIKVRSGEKVARNLLSPYAVQMLFPNQVLTAKISGKTTATTAGHTAAGVQIEYSTLTGAQQKLITASALSGNIAYVFTQTVGVKTGAIGTWTDVLANTTSNLMEANQQYALIGYHCSVTYAMVGIKAVETSTLRICGPGTIDTLCTSSYYVDRSMDYGTPWIPVVNANNRTNIRVSALAHAATVTGTVNLVWAQLKTTV